MEMSTKDTIMKKLLDAQENVRDYQMFSKQIEDKNVSEVFKDFAEQSAMQARKLEQLIDQYQGR